MSCLIFTVNLKVLGLTEAPPSLLKLRLEFISNNKEMFSKEVEDLPESLRIIVKSLRTKKRQYQDIRSRIKSSLK